MLNQQQKSEINCSMIVVSYAQIAFKKLFLQARPASAHAESKGVYCVCVLTDRVRAAFNLDKTLQNGHVLYTLF